MTTVRLRNINPLGYVDLPLIGREGPAPYLVCHDPGNCHSEHEHDQEENVVDEDGTGLAEGVGCLVPGEVFEVDAKLAGRAPKGDDPGEGLLAQTLNYELVADYPAGKPDDSWTKAQLEAYADAHDVDITGATNKAKLLAAIEKG